MIDLQTVYKRTLLKKLFLRLNLDGITKFRLLSSRHYAVFES